MADQNFDAFLLVGFGGPEKREDVIPFLENVLRGRNVPPERMLEVAEHYYHFDGVSPINTHCRELLAAVTADFAAHNVDLPLYWGNRNWAPYLPDTMATMKAAGIKRVLAFPTSAFSSYSGCRQYRENLADAVTAVGDIEVTTIRRFFNHPGFIEVMIESAKDAMAATAGTDPRFVTMVRELVAEYLNGAPPLSVGVLPPRPMVCPIDCCPRPAGRPAVR